MRRDDDDINEHGGDDADISDDALLEGFEDDEGFEDEEDEEDALFTGEEEDTYGSSSYHDERE